MYESTDDSTWDEPWSADDLTWRGRAEEVTRRQMTAMRSELGRRDSPAFERLKAYLRSPVEISGAVVAEIVQMLQHRCFADSQSFRKSRGVALWAELQWLTDDVLTDAFSVLWESEHCHWWQSSALTQHGSAGPALWAHVLSKRVDIRTVMDIAAAAYSRQDTAFLLQLENSVGTLEIVSSGQ